ncbi:hypothetical protein FGLOB1_5318 [Fusarium globosum]|uniref:Ankyrin repeat protein n=1 Tax=Fusarium globosum TaxID=78864 RepID=A0A8H6DB02_9HYPO|nr:hypothetical protein FGLOB1_5318 [Fusarium globosum]
MAADLSIQPEKARKLLSTIEPGWDAQDPPPQFERCGEQFQPSLYCAANTFSSRPDYKGERLGMITSLLRHGCDLYQEFPQAVNTSERYLKFRAPFPGEDPPRTSYPDRRVEVNSPDREERNGHPHFSDGEWDDEDSAPVWGARHLIHAITEDGIWLKPFMDYPGFLESLDLGHRDPQGRTLLLNACRSAAGADILAGTALVDADWRVENEESGQKFLPNWDRFLGPKSHTPVAMAEPLGCVRDLIRAGADSRAKDRKGNTALHYLADDDLTAMWYGEGKRELFYDLLKIAFCDDINMRNNAGKTVAELILDDDGHMDDNKANTFRLSDTEDLRGWNDVDEDVLEALDEAGYDWKAKTSEGGNLLHIVARSGVDQYRLMLRSRYLVQKGIDANEPDADGWTARKIAEHYNLNKIQFYAELERLEKGENDDYYYRMNSGG